MSIHTLKANDAKSLYGLAAISIVDSIVSVLRIKHRCNLGIVGGRTTAGLMDAIFLQMKSRKDQICGDIEVYWLDERLDWEKNFMPDVPYVAQLADLGVSIIMRPFVSMDEEGALEEVERLMRGLDSLDVILVSSGEDGHICSLFPNFPQIHSGGYGYELVYGAPKPPPFRVTVTPRLLLSAGYGYLFFVGDKVKAYRDFRDPFQSVDSCPAKLMYNIPNLVICKALDISA